jgi:hypothetical protein
MSPELQIINPINNPGWDDLLLMHEGSNIFHTSAWSKSICESYGYTPAYFTVFNNNHIKGLVPIIEVSSRLTGRRGVSLPFSDYCEPIMESKEQFHNVFNRIITFGKERKWRYIELRGGSRFLEDETPSHHYYGHNLDLADDEKQILANFRDSTQRNIKKAQKEGVTIRLSHSLESLDEFYGLNCLTRKRHGLPPQPYKFFRSVYDSIISKGKGFTAIATFKNEPVAGAVYFHYGENALYKYGASDKRYQDLRANNLVIWEAVKWYCRNGYKSLSFGRTEPENHGLRQFKSGWGTKENKIKYYKYDLQKDTFVKDTAIINPVYNKILKNLPVPILKTMGALLYRHMG